VVAGGQAGEGSSHAGAVCARTRYGSARTSSSRLVRMLQEQDRVAGIKVCGWRGVAVWLSWQAVLECIVTDALQSSPLDSLASYSYLF